MMHQLSCENSNVSSHEMDEEEKPVSASSTTLETSSNSGGKTESHQLATRHRRDANSVNHLQPDNIQTTNTIAEETTTKAYDITSSTILTSSTTLVSTSEAQTSTEVTSTEYAVATEKLQELIQEEEHTVDFLTTESTTISEIEADFTDRPSEKFPSTDTMHDNESSENGTAKYQEDIAMNKTELPQTGSLLYLNITKNISDITFNDIVNIPSEDPTQNYSKPETDAVHDKNIEEANRRRQLLPTPLRDLPQNEDNGLHETETKPENDWSLTNDSQLQPTDTEVPVKPNRGRRLTRPQAHSFYPYFLNRVLG